MFTVRNYTSSDYHQIVMLYKQSDLYGGQFDENRDSEEKISHVINRDPEAVLVCEAGEKILGTISLIEDGRVAWLFRFAVEKGTNEYEVSKALHDRALEILSARGHRQVLVYAPSGNKDFERRYSQFSFKKGNEYTCYWKNI